MVARRGSGGTRWGDPRKIASGIELSIQRQWVRGRGNWRRGVVATFLCSPSKVGPTATRAAGFRLIGMTSYLTFPSHTVFHDTYDYASLCEAWCHCFRDPNTYLPPRVPRLLLAYSDFTDPWKNATCPRTELSESIPNRAVVRNNNRRALWRLAAGGVLRAGSGNRSLDA